MAVSSPGFQNELTLLYSDLKSIPTLIKVLEADGCKIKDLRKFWKKIGEHNITHYISTFVNLEIDG